MELHQLEYFLAVEKYGSFSAASQEINVSQSTLSQQIKKLEEELGVQLFIRNPRSITLTPAGRDFLVHVVRIKQEIQYSLETIQKYTNYEKGSLILGAIPYISYLGINQLIANFVKQYPGIDYKIYSNDTDQLLRGMREKKINAAFVNYPFQNEGDFDFYPIVTDRLVMLVSQMHPLSKESEVDLKQLANERFLLIKSSSDFRQDLVAACREAGFEPNIILDGGHVDMVRDFVENGLGITLMGYRIAQSISNPNTAIIPIKQQVRRTTGLAIPKYARRLLAIQLFLDYTLKNWKMEKREEASE